MPRIVLHRVMHIDRTQLCVVAATPIEVKAVRRALPGVRIYETGVALRKMRHGFGEIVVSCGLAGGLPAELAAGTVLVPTEVRRPDGSTLRCDPELVEALAGAARRLGYEPDTRPLLTSDAIVRGEDRAAWSQRGYAGVDMETGLIVAPRIAAVRVVLDTPDRELNADWLNPARAMLDPRNWREALWLAREAPRGARRAAAIVAAACA